jgi:hypothetical protein
MIVCCGILKIRNVPGIFSENQNTHFILFNLFTENRAVYEITWKNVVQQDRP